MRRAAPPRFTTRDPKQAVNESAPATAHALAGDGRRAGRAGALDDRAGRRRPPRRGQRDRRPPGQHQAARRRHAAARQEQEIPGLGDPDRRRTPSAWAARPPNSSPAPARRTTVDIGTWCLETAPYPLTNADEGKNNFIWASKAVRGRRRLAAVRLRTARRGRTREARVDDPRLAADRHDRPRPDARAERRTRDELDARDDRSGSAAAGFEGVSEGATGDPAPGPGQPDPAARQPAARIAAVRDRLQQRHQRRLRGLRAGDRPGELPLRLQPDAGRAEQL